MSVLTAGLLALATLVSSPAAKASGKLSVRTPDSEIVNNRVVFSTVDEEIRSPKSVTLTNSGLEPLTISSLVLGDSDEIVNAANGRSGDYKRAGDFQILNAPALPLVLAPNASLELSIQFAPQRGSGIIQNSSTHSTNAENYATLSVSTDDPAQPIFKIPLAGLNAVGYEGNNEPAAAEISRSFGWSTVIGTELLKIGGDKALVGEELYSPYWVRADASKPLLAWPLARYAARKTGLQGYTKLRPKSGGTDNQILVFEGGSDESGGENQRLLPKISVDGTDVAPTAGTIGRFPNGPFGIKLDNAYINDAQNTPDQPHNWRIFPVRDKNGALVPNHWYGIVDPGNKNPTPESGKNYDYQDGVFLLANVRPESASLNPATPGLTPGNSALILFFRSAVSGTLTDVNGAGLGFTSTQRNNNDTFTSTPSYNAGLLRLSTANTGTLVLTTADSSPSRTDNNLVNGLQLAFDGRSVPFTASAKILGPLSQIAVPPYQQAGIFTGPDQDNFIKLVARATDTNTIGIEFYQERRAVGTTISTVSLANPSTLQSLELYLTADPNGSTIRSAYRAVYADLDTGVVNLPGTVTLAGGDKGRYFDLQSKAGIMAYSKDSPSIQIVYDNFQVLKANP
ncbi:hypothetical protein [Gloeobacter violaceus]|nr:hypothetical protein [Gloeobacter violaceus]